MLPDKHMHAAHKLLKKQCAKTQGCQSTLLEQNNGFKTASGEAVRIHYNAAMHWVAASSNTEGEVQLQDSRIGAVVPASLEEQLSALYIPLQ